MFESYGKYGNVFTHDILIMEHHEPDKRKRQLCGCGCRKKATHIQFCNGVAMNSGCKKSMEAIRKIRKQTRS